MQPERQTGDVDLERADRDLDVDAAAQGPGSQPTPTHHAPPVPPTNGIARSGAPEDPALGIDVLHQGEDGDADSLPISIERKEGIAPRRGDRLTDCFPQALLRRVLHFTPSWFSVNMGTGITSILLHQLPYQFKGLGIISNVIFVLNVLLFVLFLGISIARYTLWPRIWNAMLSHPQQSLFLGTFPMGFATIINMVVFTCVPAWGQRLATFAWVLWWICALLALVICIGLPFVQFTRQKQAFDQVTGVWFLPVVATVVLAASGGVVAEVLPPAHARLTIIVSYILWGTGVPIAFLLMALYYGRLAVHKIPPAALIVSTFLPIGPCGQGAFGLLQLSSVLRKLSRETDPAQALGGASLYDPTEARVIADAIYGCSIVVALILWGVGLFWLVLALMTIIDLTFVQKAPFNMGWWGFTFPLGVFATSTTSLAKELDSGGFRILGTILSLCVVALWLFVASMTAYRAWEGTIFIAPCLGETGKPPEMKKGCARLYAYGSANPTAPAPAPAKAPETAARETPKER